MTPASNSEARKREQERHTSQPAPEVGLTEAERDVLGCRCVAKYPHANSCPAPRVARIKADAIQQERAERHIVHVTAEPVAEDVVWCDECDEWVASSAPEPSSDADADATAALDAVRERAKAEALREAASDLVADCTNQSGPCICAAREWLRARAAETEAGR